MGNNKQIQRLRARDDFKNVMRKGKRLKFKDWLVINLLFHSNKKIQVGWTVPTYVGSAVVRNRFKRWLKNHLATKWEISEDLLEGCVIHFYFQKKDKSFYREMGHAGFDETIKIGLIDVEKKARASH